MRLLIAAILLTGCGCSSAPIIADAQSQIDAIKMQYHAASLVEQRYIDRPSCAVHAPPCADARVLKVVRRADYNAAALIVTADEERTARAMADAKRATDEFVAATGKLQ